MIPGIKFQIFYKVVDSKESNNLCTFCKEQAKFRLEPGEFLLCEHHKEQIEALKPIKVEISLLTYNKKRNTDEAMNKKLEGCLLTRAVRESIRKYGLKNPLVVEPRMYHTFGVLLGANRLVSCKSLNYPYVSCIVVPNDDIKLLKYIKNKYERVVYDDGTVG